MKRDPNLVPLSREHHFGLLFCWKIKQGLSKGVSLQVMRDYAVYYWQLHLREHFRKEEEILQPMLLPQDRLRLQFESEHAQLRQMFEELEQQLPDGQEPLNDLQEMLNAHIRFEERQLFPYLEERASPLQLQQIGELLAEHGPLPEDDFTPHFWLS
ncbi:hemerythrin domain-containing protein [Cesiribacter andamanensis]|uniref:Hemerythrin-like domain-containing protein n=1 Tax=Cesiribacter andamanensis AMV16 TaxID=1279009 RepID=M7N6U5_9BACT|nr:hemerythrin domain-containing protein [Cesiribacter andamanensis]EMR02956.1 hypothetical protein ADICEAN_01929 [Cesiribacter andamanensis AMV16]